MKPKVWRGPYTGRWRITDGHGTWDDQFDTQADAFYWAMVVATSHVLVP